MKFIHIADLHFDSPFTILSNNGRFGIERRIEQRQALKEVINYIKENKIQYLFISGDLYENEYIRKSTIEYINELFTEIPNTKIYISPGNHDPYIKDSFYNNFEWNRNVKIFKELEGIETEEANIYGYGFDDFYSKNCNIAQIELLNNGKPNILVIHGNLDGAKVEEKQYNVMYSRDLQKFDYVALGHIHKTNYRESQKIIYPGSILALGFDEPGEHGMIEGEIKDNKLNIEFITVDPKEFIVKEIDCTQYSTIEELLESINNIKIDENNFYEIELIGRRNFEINIYELKRMITNERILKIKNSTKINYNLEEISNEATLKGLFAKEMLERLESAKTIEEKEIIENAIEIGLEVLEK